MTPTPIVAALYTTNIPPDVDNIPLRTTINTTEIIAGIILNNILFLDFSGLLGGFNTSILSFGITYFILVFLLNLG